MVSVPVKVYVAARDESISFRQVHVCNEDKVSKVNEQNICSGCNSIVTKESMSKGYETAPGKYMVIAPEELERLKLTENKVIKIENFLPTTDVDPILYEKSYYILPSNDPKDAEAAKKPYELLFKVMQGTGMAGQATLVMRGRKQQVLIRAYKTGLVMHTLFAEAEVRDMPEFSANRDVAVSDQEVKLLKTILNAMSGPFDPSTLVDDYSIRLQAFLDAKIKGGDAPAGTPPPPPRTDDDLTNALQGTLDQLRQSKKAKAEPKKKSASAKA
jgi:DNA end-binding protein Ku